MFTSANVVTQKSHHQFETVKISAEVKKNELNNGGKLDLMGESNVLEITVRSITFYSCRIFLCIFYSGVL